MKKIYSNKIINLPNTDVFDSKFLYEYLHIEAFDGIEIFFMSELLEAKKNVDFLGSLKEKPAMWGNVYSPESELQIFKDLFDYALTNKKKIHIVGVTLGEEIKMLESYYEELGFLREDINCFDPDFSIPLVTVSLLIENIMWKGSDYKRMGDSIFFNPPVRESGEVKALFKGISRGVIAGIFIKNFEKPQEEFLEFCVCNEDILPLTLGKVLCYNFEQMGGRGQKKELIISY